MAIVVVGDWNDTVPAAAADYDNAHVAADYKGFASAAECVKAGLVPQYAVSVPRATTEKHGTIIYDPSGSPTKYLGADGNWHDVPAGSGGAYAWGDITGTLSDQEDLQTALDAKLDDSQLDTDGALAANSDTKLASQKAVKTYVDAHTGSTPAWLTESPDSPPAVPNAMDDEFSAGALDAKWSWLNQGGATATFSKGKLILYAPAAAGNNMRCLLQPLPADASWEFQAKIWVHPDAFGNYNCGGMFIRDSAGNKVCNLNSGYPVAGAGWVVDKQNYTTITSYSSNASYLVLPEHLYRYVCIGCDGANNYFRFSSNGVVWQTLVQELKGAWIANQNQIGLYAESNHASKAVRMVVDWFRRTI